MTSTISPRASDDVGARTINMVPFTDGLPPRMRRPDASGEFPIVPVVPGVQTRLIGPEELARLANGPTLILPADAIPVSLLRQAAPPAPPRYVGKRRKGDPPWAWALVHAGTFLLGVAVTAIAAIGVVR